MNVGAIILFVVAGLCFLFSAYCFGVAHGLNIAKRIHEEVWRDFR